VAPLSPWGIRGWDRPAVAFIELGWRPPVMASALLPRTHSPLLDPDLQLDPQYDRIGDQSIAPLRPIDLSGYVTPRLERPPAWESFMQGRYGLMRWQQPAGVLAAPEPEGSSSMPRLTWQLPERLELDLGGGALGLRLPTVLESDETAAAAPGACQVTRITVIRTDGESDTLPLVDCDGAVTAEAVDRLSVLARPYGVARPELPLPEQPDPIAARDGEWVPGVKLVHPRLVWLLDRIASRYPRRTVQLISGYRRDAKPNRHTQGRALDLRVTGVSNEAVFAFCQTLPDVGCGYYPNSTFVHLDVRPLNASHATWIDVSGPGEKAEYVSSWPGVIAP
jgi:hypothetical protein